jgi:hypothetical protein
VDSLAVPAAPDSAPPAPPWVPDPSLEALSLLRPERSAGVERVLFGERTDSVEPAGLASLAAHLRLVPGVRTREISQGPTAESFDLSGAGSARSALLFRGLPYAPPGTSGPQSHEVLLSELDGFAVVRGGAAALYGPDAVDGAVLALRRHPVPDEMLSRATVEEGVDDWQRGAFQVARRLGSSAALYASTESRRLEGFFPGTKEVDRQFGATLAGRLPGSLEGSVGYRRFDGDGRQGFEAAALRSVLTNRDDFHAKLLRRTPAGGALLEASLVREKLETGVGGPELLTRRFDLPGLRLTADLPSWRGALPLARVELGGIRLEREEEGRVERYVEGAAALRVTIGRGASFATATGRVDAEEGRPATAHARLEGEWTRGRLAAFGVASRGARLPDRGAARGEDPEVHVAAEAGAGVRTGSFRWRGVLFASDVADARREPTIEEIRAREPVRDAPVGDLEIRGARAGLDSERFPVPGLRWLGDLRLSTGVTWLSAENATTGARLPGRASLSWTGQGSLERRLFRGELLARVRGRLTHVRDRVDDAGAEVEDAWVTDVLLEGEVGDAAVFFRFHDLLERADEIEPGVRLPGFSRMWGITWRFVG